MSSSIFLYLTNGKLNATHTHVMAICVTFRWEIFAADKDTSYIDMRRGSKYGDSATETKPHVGALCIWYPCSLMNFIAWRFRTRSGHIPIYSVSCRRDDVDGKVWRAVTILSLSPSLERTRSWIYMNGRAIDRLRHRRIERSTRLLFPCLS